MKKKFAAHQVIVSNGNHYKQYVVEIENKAVIRFFPLKEEVAFTEWIGGTIILSPYNELIKEIKFPVKIEYLMTILTEVCDHQSSLYAWHISAEDTLEGVVHSVRQLQT